MRTKFSGFLTLIMAFMVQIGFAQQQTITGTVTDSDNGMPLAGVNIVIEGTSSGTQSDFDGNFSLRVNEGQVLVFTYTGYSDKKVDVGSNNVINVQMAKGAELSEVIVTAYRTTTKKETTQAVTFISTDNIEDRPNASVLQSLQGQVAGLNIATSTGQPGADSNIILRGPGSINGNIEPLIILDGVPIDEDNLKHINQNNIASVAVLKDAAATSIYGNRGANGVIIIETKRARYGEKLKIGYSSQFGISELPELTLELMNSREKLTFQRDYANAGMGVGMTDAEIDAYANRTNTYWADYFFRKGVYNQQNLTLSVGSKNTTNYTSIGYLEQEGVFVASDLQRFSFRNNFTGKTNDDKFNYSIALNTSFTKSNFEPTQDINNANARGIYFNPFFNALQGLPTMSPFDPDGSVTTDGGIPYGDTSALLAPLAPYVLLNSIHMNTRQNDELKATGNLKGTYRFAENFHATGSFGVDLTTQKRYRLLHPLSLLGPFQADSRAEFGGIQDHFYDRDARFNTLFNIGYTNTFNEKHTVTANLYTEYLKSHFQSSGFSARGIDPKTIGSGNEFKEEVSEDLDGDGNPDFPYIPNVSAFNIETGLFSYFLNADYDFDGRYGFSGTIRRDASFRFVDDNQWGTFYAVSGRWNIDQESFMDGSVFNLLKLRASYGTSGNQRISGGYYGALNLFSDLYSSVDGYNNSSAYVASQIANPDLRWEETSQLNFGVDFALWNNRLQGNVDVYRKLTDGLFQSRPISPTANATSAISDNIGSMENKGAEIFLQYTLLDKNDWNIVVWGNTSYNKNEILELPAADENGVILGTGSISLGEGQPLGSFYSVRYAGVNPANGNGLFYDVDGNLTEDLNASTDRVYTDKSIYPTWQGGFGATISFKNFTLSNQWVYFGDLYRNNLDLADLEGTSSYEDFNSSASLFDAWQQPGDITHIPRLYDQYNTITYLNQTDRYIQDASYLRLRNVSLSYSFSDKILDNTFVNSLEIFVQGENLLTFSKWKGWDPEGGFGATGGSAYPTARTYSLGINVNF